MQDRRVRLTIAAIALLLLFGGGISLLASRRQVPPPIVITQPASAETSSAVPSPVPTPVAPQPTPPPAPTPQAKYYVHVAGAVKNPSLYLLAPGSRVMQAVKAAGGPTSKADLDAVNLAEKVKDGEKVYIPTKTAAVPPVMLAPPGNVIGHASVAPASPPSGDAATPPTASVTPAKAAKSAKGSSAGKAAKLSSPAQGQVNINTASTDQLQRLPGIGPAMAARILAYRQQAGGFQKVEELQEISGIGPKKYAKLAPLVKLQ